MADGTIPAPAKICTKCKIEKPATAEFFHRDSAGPGGFTYACKACRYQRRPLRTLGATRRCSICRKEKPATPEFFGRNRSIRIGGLSYRCRSCIAATRVSNRELVRAYGRAHHARHRQRLLERQRIYRLKNRDRLRASQRVFARAIRKVKKHDPNWMVSKAVSSSLLKALRHRKDGAHWESLVGYGRKELVRHLERQFSSDMSWDNFGKAWHIDHIVPVASFTFTSKDDPEVKRCWALSNLRPLLKIDNLSKGAKRIYLI